MANGHQFAEGGVRLGIHVPGEPVEQGAKAASEHLAEAFWLVAI
jgi:hypothetical protein